MQIMGLISEMMGISFGQADIYRRALEKMHKPANKKKVEYFEENCVKLAVERGIPKEDAEYIKGMILDNCGYAFNKCLSGREIIKGSSLTIKEMYNQHKFGKALSMNKDNKIIINNIVDIKYSGKKAVFKVIMENEEHIECTMNHSFPTPNGKKILAELGINSELYIYNKGSIKISKIKSIEFVCVEDVYDVEMEDPYHNFLVDGDIVTSNSHKMCGIV